MSPHLYDRLLTLVDEVSKATRGLQVILTNTVDKWQSLRWLEDAIQRLRFNVSLMAYSLAFLRHSTRFEWLS